LVKVVDIQDNFFEVIRGEVAMAMGKEIAMSGNGVREDFTNNGIEIGRHAGRVARRREGRKGQGKSPSDGKRGSFNARGAGGNATQLGGY
jgi:hypothetical protein